jgi:hypothetical protein
MSHPLLRTLISEMVENYLEEETNVSSGPAQHALEGRSEMKDHADYMQKSME